MSDIDPVQVTVEVPRDELSSKEIVKTIDEALYESDLNEWNRRPVNSAVPSKDIQELVEDLRSEANTDSIEAMTPSQAVLHCSRELEVLIED
jgi:hypothetical protein